MTNKPKRQSSAPSAPSRQLSNVPTSSRAEAGSQRTIRNTERCKGKASRKEASKGDSEDILKRYKQRSKAEKSSVVILKRKQPSQWRTESEDEPESSTQEERPRKKSRDDKGHPEHSSDKKNRHRTKSRDNENSCEFENVFGEKLSINKMPKKAKQALVESSNILENQRKAGPEIDEIHTDEQRESIESPTREFQEPMPQIDFGSDDSEDNANEVICIGDVPKVSANNEEAIYISDSEEDSLKEDDREVEVWEQEDYFDQF